MTALDLVKLPPLMDRTSGRPEIVIGLIDGPIAVDHADLAHEHIRAVSGAALRSCTLANSIACQHGTFVGGILAAKRGSAAPAICPGCTLLVCPIFGESASLALSLPTATPSDLANALVRTIEAGARIVNLSMALTQLSTVGQSLLEEVLEDACQRGVLVVAAAGNQGIVGSSLLTRHPWVIPVAACDLRGRPTGESNLGGSLAQWGLCAPGDQITSLGTDGHPRTLGGTSVAAPFVTGTLALLWSEFPHAAAAQIKYAATLAYTRRRGSIVPPLLDAWSAYHHLAHSRGP